MARADDAPAQTQTGGGHAAGSRRDRAEAPGEAASTCPWGSPRSRAQICNRCISSDFADLESQVPGLSVELIAPGLDRLTIRGENVGGVGSTVTTYIDDVPFGSSNALANGSSLAGDFDTWDLQRVEVLRGPQGTLYGAGSEGGLLKYVTNPPDPSRASQRVRARRRGRRARRQRPFLQGDGQPPGRRHRRASPRRLLHQHARLYQRSAARRDATSIAATGRAARASFLRQRDRRFLDPVVGLRPDAAYRRRAPRST